MAESYQYRSTYRGTRRVPAVTVQSELQRLESERGEVQASNVVEAAEPESAPLHPCFTWDDTTAAREYRLIEARQLIRAIIVVSKDSDKPTESVYVHVPARDWTEGAYMRPAVVIQEIDSYERALTEATRDLEAAERRFNELRRLAGERGGRTEALAIAVQGFSAVRQALDLLRVA